MFTCRSQVQSIMTTEILHVIRNKLKRVNTEAVGVEQSTRCTVPEDLNLQIKISNKINSINIMNQVTPPNKFLLFGIDYSPSQSRIFARNFFTLFPRVRHVCLNIHLSMNGATAPSGVWSQSNDTSILLYLQFVFSNLIFRPFCSWFSY